MPSACINPVPAPCRPAVADPRVLNSFYNRFNAATKQALLGPATQTPNGDEAAYADKCGTYSKCVLQSSPGVVNHAAFIDFRNAINSGLFSDFEAVPLGGSRTLNGPMGAYAFTDMGADCVQFGNPPVIAAPALASDDYATELIELYWASLLRDVAFTDYGSSTIAQNAASELTSIVAHYGGPVDGSNKVTPELLFRGKFAGETIGPYISQFLITPTMLGAQPISQQYLIYQSGFDYMTDLPTWFDVQNGISTGILNVNDPVHQYLHNGRGLATYTHIDVLYQAYFTALLVLGTIGTPFNPGNPYDHSKTQNGFGTFGAPDFAATLAQVAKIALNTVWYQKWVVHLRHRPESGGGLVHLINSGKTFDGSPSPLIFNSNALKASYLKYGTWLLSQAFPEGSPAHPAYPTGHGTVGGACITVLKFFFNGDYPFPNPQVPSSDGTSLVPWEYDPTIGGNGPLTINGELHKLAHNISFGHGIHAGIHWRSDTDISIELGEAIALSFLDDLACTYAEPFSVTITKLDGSPRTITNM